MSVKLSVVRRGDHDVDAVKHTVVKRLLHKANIRHFTKPIAQLRRGDSYRAAVGQKLLRLAKRHRAAADDEDIHALNIHKKREIRHIFLPFQS